MQNQFSYIDKEFKLTTVNRQNSFYYRITKPIEVWGNYHAQIAFFDRHNEIVYHRQTCFAHVLSGDNSMQFVEWSDNGEAVLFYEYRRGHIEHEGVYYYLFVDLKEKVVYRIDLNKYEHSFLDNLISYNFDKIEIINRLLKIGIDKENCFTDKITISPIRWLTGVDKWRPSAKL
jgi:hypothetical protein